MLDHATSKITSDSKLGLDAAKRIPGEPRRLSGLAAALKMDAAVKAKAENHLHQK